MKIQIYLERELIDLMPEFEQIFEVDNLYHDYENVWEWLESRDRNSRYYVNISRPHNWEKGDYQKPILLIIEPTNGEPLNENQLIDKLKDRFQCAVTTVNVDLQNM